MVLVLTEAAYSLHNRVFMGNLRTIILYAVFGTIFNFLLIGIKKTIVDVGCVYNYIAH